MFQASLIVHRLLIIDGFFVVAGLPPAETAAAFLLDRLQIN